LTNGQKTANGLRFQLNNGQLFILRGAHDYTLFIGDATPKGQLGLSESGHEPSKLNDLPTSRRAVVLYELQTVLGVLDSKK